MFSPANSYDFLNQDIRVKFIKLRLIISLVLNYHTDEKKKESKFHFHQDFTHTYWQNGPQATGYRTFVRPSIKINKKQRIEASLYAPIQF